MLTLNSVLNVSMTSEDIGKPHKINRTHSENYSATCGSGGSKPDKYSRVIIKYIETRLGRGTPGYSLSLEEGAGNGGGGGDGGGGGGQGDGGY